MAASLPSFCSISSRRSYPKRCNMRQGLQVIRSHSFQEEGRSMNNAVHANLNVLRERMEMVRMKERLERCCRCKHGWNYAPMYNHKRRRGKQLSKLVELTCLVSGTVGFTCFSGTFFLCLVSLIVHMLG